MIDIPSLPEFQTKAKLPFLSSISTSKDPMIKEIFNLLLDREYTKGQGIPDAAVELLNKAKSSISTINSKTLSNQSCRINRESKAKTYDAKLTQLTIQNKFLSVTQLKAKNHVWKRIMDGLPAGQMFFLLRAGTDMHLT